MRTAIVVGSGACVWDDLDKIEAANIKGEYIVVNDMGIHWQKEAFAWASLHGENFPLWSDRRRREGLPQIMRLITGKSAGDWEQVQKLAEVYEAKFEGQVVGGSSGHFAVKIALEDLGFDRVILAGIPMTITNAHFNDTRPWDECPGFLEGWRQSMPHIKGRVFSYSGWTRHMLGMPPHG